MEFDWNSVDSVLMPNKCILHHQRCTLILLAARKMHWKMPVLQVWHFNYRILQVQWRRMLYLSLPLESVWHCIRYASIKVFSKPNFWHLWTESKDIQESLYLKKPIFYSVWRISLISPEMYLLLIKNNRNYTVNN